MRCQRATPLGVPLLGKSCVRDSVPARRASLRRVSSSVALAGTIIDGGPHSGHFTGLILTRGRPKKIFIFGVPNFFFFIGLRPSETNRKDEKKIIHTTRLLSCTCLYIYVCVSVCVCVCVCMCSPETCIPRSSVPNVPVFRGHLVFRGPSSEVRPNIHATRAYDLGVLPGKVWAKTS